VIKAPRIWTRLGPGFACLMQSHSVTYFKRKGSPALFAKEIVHEDDPRVPMTSAEFLAKAWKVANDKARELGRIV
jgi:hypothetical protein